MFQMLRGTMVVFAGLLTIVILRRKLHLHHWMGIILILAGAALVGASRWASLPVLAAPSLWQNFPTLTVSCAQRII